MGNDQSTNASKVQKLSQAEIKRLLNQQRQIYEAKCQEYTNQAARSAEAAAKSEQNTQATRNAQAAANVAQNPQAAHSAQPTPPLYTAQPGMHWHQSAYTPQPACVPPMYAQAPPLFAQNSSQGTSFSGYNDDRPVSDSNLFPARGNTPSAQPLYPNLNNLTRPPAKFSFANNNTKPNLKNNAQGQRVRPSAPFRDRSASRSRNSTNDELNCRTCRTLFGLQIYQCNQGHSSCSNCKEQSRCCGICGNNITAMRNFTLEGYMAEQKVPCPHNNGGCTLSFKMAELDIHTKECPFKELHCPLGCVWKGYLKQLSVHCDAMHPQQRTADIDSEMQLRDISNNSQNVYLILIGSFNFLFHVKVSAIDAKIYMTVQLIGTKVSACKWTYEVQVYNKNEPRRKFIFTDDCTSYVEPLADILKDGKCSVLSLEYASTFMNKDALNYKIFIKKSAEVRPRNDFVQNQRGRGRK